MKIVCDVPPNFAAIKAKFDPPASAIYCYGKIIYAPAGGRVPPELILHEGVHSRRQGTNVEEWWQRYIDDPRFRLAEEIPAHKVEFNFLRSRGKNAEYVIERLCSPLYGNLLSRAEAAKLIANRS